MISQRVDVLVIGGGPAGLYAAWRFADAGFDVLTCEEHADIGAPVHCTGVMADSSFDEFTLPRDAILNPLRTVRFVSPAALEVTYTPSTITAVVIDRGRFDQHLASSAAAAGATIRVGARADALEISADGVRARVGSRAVEARLAILACGASYKLQRRAGLGLPGAFLLTAQRELPADRLGDVEVYFGKSVAPGGFAWAVPVRRPEGTFVRIGLMATREPAGWYRALLSRMRPRWRIRDDHSGPPRLKFLPLRSIQRTYADRLLVVGDAAGLVKPTTGGGIHYSILSAALAADVAIPALRTGRLGAGVLAAYEKQWRRRLSTEFQAQWALRSIAQRMSDGQIDALFHLAQTDGVMPLVHRTANFNQHRELIHALLRHAPARRIFWPARG